MKKFTKIAMTVLAGVLATVTVAGCGGGGDGVTTTGQMNYDENGKPIFKNVDIDLATVVTGDDFAPFNNIVTEFNNEYSGKININISNIAQDTFEKSVGQAIQTNVNAPDLIMCHVKSHKNFAENKLIQPFEEGYEAAKLTFDKTNIVTGLAGSSDLGMGKQYSIPVDAQSMVIYYNKTMLADLGKEVPTTHEELLDVCAAFKTKYTNSDYCPISCDVVGSEYFFKYLFPTAYVANGGTLFDSATYKADWTGEANMQAFNDAKTAIRTDLIDAGYFKWNENAATVQTRFFENKTLFLIDRPWAAQSLFSGYKLKNSSVTDATTVLGGASIGGLFALDSTKDYANKIYGDSHGFMMSRTVSDINVKAAIAEFVNWYTTNNEVGAAWGQAGHASVSKTVANSAEYKANAFVNDYVKNFYTDLDKFVTMSNNLHYSEIILRLDEIATKVIATNDSVSAIVSEQQKKYNDYVDLQSLSS